jgi:hypothetical protein
VPLFLRKGPCPASYSTFSSLLSKRDLGASFNQGGASGAAPGRTGLGRAGPGPAGAAYLAERGVMPPFCGAEEGLGAAARRPASPQQRAPQRKSMLSERPLDRLLTSSGSRARASAAAAAAPPGAGTEPGPPARGVSGNEMELRRRRP